MSFLFTSFPAADKLRDVMSTAPWSHISSCLKSDVLPVFLLTRKSTSSALSKTTSHFLVGFSRSQLRNRPSMSALRSSRPGMRISSTISRTLYSYRASLLAWIHSTQVSGDVCRT